MREPAATVHALSTLRWLRAGMVNVARPHGDHAVLGAARRVVVDAHPEQSVKPSRPALLL
ncbi:MAG: hypothetical protein U0325_34650 [Polyangiales bacterium]